MRWRVTEPGRIRVFLKVKVASFGGAARPADQRSDRILKPVYPCMVPAKNVLQTALQNGNPVIHPRSRCSTPRCRTDRRRSFL